jgi:hypothetical protein
MWETLRSSKGLPMNPLNRELIYSVIVLGRILLT